MNDKRVAYPQSPSEWIDWITTLLEITHEEGTRLVKNGAFPFDLLVKAWEDEFNVKNGYHPDFIPALIRNKIGFVKWVYCEGSEPNWSRADEI
jgi:hypothetical protein